MDNILNAGYKNRKKLTFSWEIVTTCQYRCDYCYAYDILEKKFDKKLLKIYKLVLLKLKQLNYKFDVELLGGEPTTHPEIKDILLGLQRNKNCNSIELVTNMVKPLSFYKELDDKKFSKTLIAASYHPQYDSNNKYALKCVEVNKFDNIKIYCNINLPKENKQWSKIRDTLDILTANKVDVGLNFLITVKDKYESYYSDEFRDFFKDYLIDNDNIGKKYFPYNINGEEKMLDEYYIKLNGLYDFKGYKCTPLTFCIDKTGIFSNSCSGKEISNINDLVQTFRCPVNGGCNCDLLYNYYKEK